jgi:hypothetical protein
MSTQPLLHSLPLWYYPPHVTDVYADFETAARGYCTRLDTFNPTQGLKRKLDNVQNRRADEGTFFFCICHGHRSRHSSDGRRAKRAKSIEAKLVGPSNNRELRRLVDAVARFAKAKELARKEVCSRLFFHAPHRSY